MFTSFCKFRAFINSLRAIMQTDSGAIKASRRYPRRRLRMIQALSSRPGRFGCTAFQVHRKIVARQLQTSPIVPRVCGSGAQPTMPVVFMVKDRGLRIATMSDENDDKNSEQAERLL